MAVNLDGAHMRVILTAIAACLLTAACSGPTTPTQTTTAVPQPPTTSQPVVYTFSGSVADSLFGAPISGASFTVTASDGQRFAATTDALGRFSFSGVASGLCSYVASGGTSSIAGAFPVTIHQAAGSIVLDRNFSTIVVVPLDWPSASAMTTSDLTGIWTGSAPASSIYTSFRLYAWQHDGGVGAIIVDPAGRHDQGGAAWTPPNLLISFKPDPTAAADDFNLEAVIDSARQIRGVIRHPHASYFGVPNFTMTR
jgi:hypothetical protein